MSEHELSVTSTQIEKFMLLMWAKAGIEEVYRYKHRIVHYREPHTSLDLFYDLTHGTLFADIVDVASQPHGVWPRDLKVSVETLMRNRGMEYGVQSTG